uniref:Proline-rich protein 29 n=1 Tax=Pogona vitticeps TaxID=103695 RepID=A0A6J0SY07_9SAUR
MDPGGQGTVSPGVHFIQQPIAQQPEVTILQQLPWMPQALPPASRKKQIKKDLMELMMIQNAQMYQVVMNNLAMTAMAHFEQSPAQASNVLWHIEEDEEDSPTPFVFHHHYVPYPSTVPVMAWQPPFQPPAWPRQQPVIRHVGPAIQTRRGPDGQAVPPPPPPSATGTVTADVPPASEYYDFSEGQL